MGAYEWVQFTLTVTVEGEGVVTSMPEGINCGVSCTAAFEYGEAVTLVASAAEAHRLGSWGGGCTGNGACLVTLTGDQSVTARFELAHYPIYLPRIGRE